MSWNVLGKSVQRGFAIHLAQRVNVDLVLIQEPGASFTNASGIVEDGWNCLSVESNERRCITALWGAGVNVGQATDLRVGAGGQSMFCMVVAPQMIFRLASCHAQFTDRGGGGRGGSSVAGQWMVDFHKACRTRVIDFSIGDTNLAGTVAPRRNPSRGEPRTILGDRATTVNRNTGQGISSYDRAYLYTDTLACQAAGRVLAEYRGNWAKDGDLVVGLNGNESSQYSQTDHIPIYCDLA